MSGQHHDALQARRAASFHEAGHAVAAVALGGRIHRAMLGDQPRTEYDQLPVNAAAVTYAGPWCEARCLSGRYPAPHDIHRALCVNASDARALTAAGEPTAGRDVVPLLDRCWPAVKAVAKVLFVKGRVDHAGVCAALGLSDDGGPGSFELAGPDSGQVSAHQGCRS
jgi:hypothetical protein